MLEYMFNGYQIAAGEIQGELDAAVNIVSHVGDVKFTEPSGAYTPPTRMLRVPLTWS